MINPNQSINTISSLNPFLMKNLLMFSLAVLMFLVFGCKKSVDSSPKEQHYLIDTAVFSYLDLPVGRYFIYKDSASGTTDSVTVKNTVC